MSQKPHNAMLSRFLKLRRAALSPRDFGLPEKGRRRTPGLRREEVALLAGLSVSWYTWLEQGRDISVSSDIIERLSSVLKLDAAQREFLFALVHSRPAPLTPADPTERFDAGPMVWRALDALSVPAFAMTYRWDVVAWNRLMLMFRDYSKLPPDSRNLLRIMVSDPIHRIDPEEYERKVRLATARVRFEYTQAGEDPVFDALIDELNESCPVFKYYWQESVGVSEAEGTNTVSHPELGAFTFEHAAYIPKSDPHLRIVVFLPKDDVCADKLARLAGDVAVPTTAAS